MKNLLILSTLVLLPVVLFAEELTITTYYPSPYGSYNELSTNYLTYGIGLASPPVKGVSCSVEGQTAYSSSAKQIFLCAGNKWKSLGGESSILGIHASGNFTNVPPRNVWTLIPGLTMTEDIPAGKTIFVFTIAGLHRPAGHSIDDDVHFRILVDGVQSGYGFVELPANLITTATVTGQFTADTAASRTITVEWKANDNAQHLEGVNEAVRSLIAIPLVN